MPPPAEASAGELVDEPRRVTPEIAAEAAVWVARLHGPDRSPAMERDCRQWQGLSPVHRLAFERCTETWLDVPGIKLADAYATASVQAAQAARTPAWRPVRVRWVAALLLVAAISGVVLYLQPWRSGAAYDTEVGGQQMVVLADGTRMSLNTNTRARVQITSSERSVSVERGEALFEVAKDPRRPFTVRVAGSEVVALGTTFSVRLTSKGTQASDSLAVALIEGQVSVRAAQDGGNGDGVAPAQPVLMQAGQRVRIAKAPGGSVLAPEVDRPRMEQVVAWKRSEAVFDDVSLPDAVDEMNRYSRTPIVLFNASGLENRRVSGVFRTGNNASFARAIASLHGLIVNERDGRIELSLAQ